LRDTIEKNNVSYLGLPFVLPPFLFDVDVDDVDVPIPSSFRSCSLPKDDDDV